MTLSNHLRYTLVFLTHGNEVLMLHRNKQPNKGMWNGVGGRIEHGESPLACAVREVYEETGYQIETARFSGLLTWKGFNLSDGGLYLFTVEVSEVKEPVKCSEGLLAWKSKDWVLSSSEVVSNIHWFGQTVFQGQNPCLHHFVYEEGNIVQYSITPLSNDIDVR